MIGYKKKFVFVHIPKTAGQSVTKVLRKHALEPHQAAVQWIGRRLGRHVKYDHYRILPGHETITEIGAVLGSERLATFFSFAFVRNPWDRMVSLYHFEQMDPRRARYDLATSNDFEGFLEGVAQEGTRQQVDYISDGSGRIAVNFVGRFETLAADMEHICRTIGIPFDLPHKNSSGRRDYRASYTARSVDLVSSMFARDIQAFGYSFDTPQGGRSDG